MSDAAKYLVALGTLVGLLISASVFIATFASRPALERAMSEFVRARVQQEVRERLSSAAGADAPALQEWFEGQRGAATDFLENHLDTVVNRVVDSLCGVDCETSKKDDLNERLRRIGRDLLKQKIHESDAISTQLTEFIRGRYLHLVRALISEIRIFAGINTGLFAIVLLLLVANWREPRVVLLPASLLLIATLVCGGLYVFNRNWFLSIFLQQYPGYLYLTYVGIAFALMLDIAFNRGRITRSIIDGVAGAMASLTP